MLRFKVVTPWYGRNLGQLRYAIMRNRKAPKAVSLWHKRAGVVWPGSHLCHFQKHRACRQWWIGYWEWQLRHTQICWRLWPPPPATQQWSSPILDKLLQLLKPCLLIILTINQCRLPVKSCAVRCFGQASWGVMSQVNFLTKCSSRGPRSGQRLAKGFSGQLSYTML